MTLSQLMPDLMALTEFACKLLFEGKITLQAARDVSRKSVVGHGGGSPDYVKAILGDAAAMPEDVLLDFIGSKTTIRGARTVLLARLVAEKRLTAEQASAFAICEVDLDTIRSTAYREQASL
jgi:hypothetical protein